MRVCRSSSERSKVIADAQIIPHMSDISVGLTFGSISALFGLSHGIVTQDQYSLLIAAVIGSAVVPTLIANAFFLPHHLIGPAGAAPGEEAAAAKPARAKTAAPATGTKA